MRTSEDLKNEVCNVDKRTSGTTLNELEMKRDLGVLVDHKHSRKKCRVALTKF